MAYRVKVTRAIVQHEEVTLVLDSSSQAIAKEAALALARKAETPWRRVNGQRKRVTKVEVLP